MSLPNEHDTLRDYKQVDACLFPCWDHSLKRNPRQLHQLVAQEQAWKNDLYEFCRTENVQPLSVFQACWALVLRAFTGSDNTLFGTSDARKGNQPSHCPRLTGCAFDLQGEMSLADVIRKRVEIDVEPAKSSQMGDRLLNQQVGRMTKKFNTIVEVSTSDDLAPKSSIPEEQGQFDILVRLKAESDQDLNLSMAYSSTLLDSLQAKNVLATFERALVNTLSSPHRNVQHLSLCTEADLDQLMQWNRHLPSPSLMCLDELVAQRNRGRGGELAISAWDGTFTYTELDNLSTQLAGFLMSLNLDVGSFVPLLFEKSKWVIVSMLGIIKAGHAYVHLDPSSPIQRTKRIYKDIDAKIILTSPSFVQMADQMSDHVIEIHATASAWREVPGPVKNVNKTSAQALYTTFTSGSTGVPKGVVVAHGAFCTRALAVAPVFGLNQESRVLQFASYAFDVSHRDIWFTLVSGGCLCIPSEVDRLNYLTRFINDHKVNWASLTATVADVLDPNDVPTLETLVLAGEPMSSRHVATWADRVHLMNAYGPSECITTSTVNPHMTIDSDHNNIGRGIGSAIWIVDAHDPHKLVPIGAVGEMVIEGPATSEGYLHLEKLNLEVFLTNLAWRTGLPPVQGSRMYKTGDLARFAAGHTIEFLGRKDNQVKINGQRVELGEIEHHVHLYMHRKMSALHPQTAITIHVAVDLTPTQDDRRPQLLLFLHFQCKEDDWQLDQGTDLRITIDGLADHLESYLPSHMVPRACLYLHELPKTATDKVDRRKLRAIGGSTPSNMLMSLRPVQAGHITYRMPATPLERQLQRLWAAVFSIDSEKIGADDNFLSLGGDSITAMRLVAAARKEGLSLRPIDILEQPQLSSQARLPDLLLSSTVEIPEPFELLEPELHSEKTREQVATLCSVSPDTIEDILPCTPLQEGLLALTARRGRQYIRHFEWKLAAHTDMRRLRTAWEEVVAKNAIFRTRIVDMLEHGLLQVVVREQVHWSTGDDLVSFRDDALKDPMGVGTVLARHGLVVDKTSGDGYLVVTVHHALYDGWSAPLALTSLADVYHGVQGEAMLPFSTFVRHVRETNRTAAEEFWKSQFVDLDTVQFPLLHSSMYEPTADITVAHEIRQLHHLGGHFTIASAIQVAWAIVQTRYTSCLDAVFGLVRIGRQAAVPGIERVMGPTMTTVPITVRVDASTKVSEVLHDIHVRSIDMIPFEQIGMQNIKKLNTDTARACDFQTLLLIQPDLDELSAGHTSLVRQEDVSEMDRLEDFTSYALMLRFELQENGMRLLLSFDSSLIKEQEVVRLAQQFEQVLRQICAPRNDLLTIDDVDLLTEHDRSQLWSWNKSVPSGEQGSVHALLDNKMQEQAMSVAICAWDGDITYRELQQLSTSLGTELVSMNVRSGSPVIICMETSKWLPVAMIGTMRTGAYSVVIDSSQSQDRLESLAQQLRPAVILCSKVTRPSTGRTSGIPILVVEQSCTLASGDSRADRLPDVDASSKLCATLPVADADGEEQFIMTHQALRSAARELHKVTNLTTKSRVISHAVTGTSTFWLNLFHCFVFGGCFCMPADNRLMKDPTAAIIDLGITHAHLMPRSARLLAYSQLQNLEVVIVCSDHAEEYEPIAPGGTVKLFVSKEYPGCSGLGVIEPVQPVSRSALSIGKSCNAWIVRPSKRHHLAAIGCPGELWLEGPLVSTEDFLSCSSRKEAYVQNPPWLLRGATGRPGRRGVLCNTGAIAKYDPAGNIIPLSKRTTRWLINGKKVEPHVVESRVQRAIHGRISGHVEIVVDVMVPTDRSDAILIAYICVIDDIEGELLDMSSVATMVQVLTNDMCFDLPQHMVPTGYLVLTEFPVAHTDTVDRTRLRKASHAMRMNNFITPNVHTATKRIRGPSSPSESQLRGIWAVLFRTPEEGISTEDAFFELGGDSVLAMRLVALANRKGYSITVPDVFRMPKLSDLARLLSSQPGQGAPSLEIPRLSLLRTSKAPEALLEEIALLCGVSNDSIADAFPCTPLQEGLLALNARRKTDAVTTKILPLRSDVNLVAFRKAWNHVVETTGILQTIILDLPGEGLVQVVLNERSRWRTNDSEALATDIPAEDMGLGLRLAQYGLTRDPHSDVRCLVLHAHHAIYDGWLLSKLLAAVEQVYFGESIRPFVPFQRFVHFVQSTNTESTNRFWRERLADLEAPIFPDLPHAQLRPEPDQTVVHYVNRLAKVQTTTTLSTAIHLAWSLIVSVYTGADDVLFGSVVTGRQASIADADCVAGPTIATIPVRVTLSWDASVKQTLERIQADAVNSVPFEQAGLQHIRRLSDEAERACQFQTLMVIQLPDDDRTPNRLFAETASVSDKALSDVAATSPFALVLEFKLLQNGIRARVSLDTRVISRTQVVNMLDQFEHVLRQVVLHSQHQSNTLSQVELTSPQDLKTIFQRNKLLPQPANVCLQDLVAEVVRRQPSKLAIDAWDGSLSYSELDELSTALAGRLHNAGVRPHGYVPILFGKSRWLPVTILAVAKVGGAMVLLDPRHPIERLRDMCRNLNASVMMTCLQYAHIAANLTGRVVEVSDGQLADSTSVRDFTVHSSKPSDILYVGFTSGSTGIPKGALITHGAVLSNALALQAQLRADPDTRVFQFASPSFDMCLWDFIIAWVVGGCLCMASDADTINKMAESICRFQANFMHTTPSVLRALSPEETPTLKHIILGGEMISKADVLPWQNVVNLCNGYGPMECGTCVSVRPSLTVDTNLNNIGVPYATVPWIVGPQNHAILLPVGAVGELLLEGPAVGEGYLNDAPKTAQAFVKAPPWRLNPDAVRAQSQPILYKTGDLVKYADDGSLIFMGRKDRQVKIRGQRVELGEIEFRLKQGLKDIYATGKSEDDKLKLETIAEVVKTPTNNRDVLVAFLLRDRNYGGSKSESNSDVPAEVVDDVVAQLAIKLGEQLPSYMVPSVFIPINDIPLTATGKTDRRRLLKIGLRDYEKYRDRHTKSQQRHPSGPLETTLVELLAEVLSLSSKQVSMDSKFTRLGGDSITAMQMVSRCRARNVRTTIADVLESRTIWELASKCSWTTERTEITDSLKTDNVAWPLSPFQQMLFKKRLDGLDMPNQNRLLRLKGCFTQDQVRAAVFVVAGRHGMLRARFRKTSDCGWEQLVTELTSDAIAFSYSQIKSSDDVRSISRERQQDLDVECGPVFAADHFRLPNGAQSLLLTAHHLIIDPVSWRVICHELDSYLSRAGDISFKNTASFQTWCDKQRQLTQNLRPSELLPVSLSCPDQSYWGIEATDDAFENCEERTTSLGTDVTAQLLGQCNDSMRTDVIDTLLAMLTYSFSDVFADRPLPTVFVESDGRKQSTESDADISSTVGCFTTVYPLQLQVQPESSRLEMIRLTKDRRHETASGGRDYVAWRCLTESGREAFETHQVPEISFSCDELYQYKDNDESVLLRDDEFEGWSSWVHVSPRPKRAALIELDVHMSQGMMKVNYRFPKSIQQRAKVLRWIDLVKSNLTQVVGEMLSSPSVFTKSDFPLVPMSYTGLDMLHRQLSQMHVSRHMIEDLYPCTPLQTGILLSVEKRRATYMNHLIWRYETAGSDRDISPSKLRDAWRSVVQHHSILSTIFITLPDTGDFAQLTLIDPSTRVVLRSSGSVDPVHFLTNCESPNFPPNVPPHQLSICHASDGRVACRLDISHALLDASSDNILIDDLARVYAGEHIEAPPFRDYVRYLSRESKSERLKHWKAFLDGVKATHLPVLTPSPSVRESPESGLVASNKVEIPEAVTDPILSFCQTHGLSRAAFIQVAWSLVLSWFTRNQDVCYGYMTSGRDSPIENIDAMVGPLIGITVGRVQLTSDLIGVVKELATQSVSHARYRHTSLAEVQKHLKLESQALFNTCISVTQGSRSTTQTTGGLVPRLVESSDPHEFTIGISARLTRSHTSVWFNCRRGQVDQALAGEIASVLRAAISCLLESQPVEAVSAPLKTLPQPVQESVAKNEPTEAGTRRTIVIGQSNVFFTYLTAMDQQSTIDFWQSQCRNFSAEHFPALLLPSHPSEIKNCVFELRQTAPSKLACDLTTAIHTAWAILAAHHSATEDVVFGVQCSPRTPPGAHQGHKSLPLRVCLNWQEPVSVLRDRVHGALEQVVRFANVGVDWISRLNDEAHIACQFHALLITDSSSSSHATRDRIDLEESRRRPLTLRFDISDEKLTLRANYDTAMIDSDRMNKLVKQFDRTLHQVCVTESRELLVKDIATISDNDLHTVWSWNREVPVAIDRCLHELIAERALAQPHSLAVTGWDGEFTYAQVESISTQVARHLAPRTSSGMIVPIFFEKSVWTPIAVLAVLKAGGAGFLVDTTLPEERIRSVMEQIKPHFALSSEAHSAVARRIARVDVVVINQSQLNVMNANGAGSARLPEVKPTDLLYAIFTSGSTGKPKGVLNSHRNFASAVHHQHHMWAIGPGSRIFDVASYAFDVAWWNLLTVLARGACLCVPNQSDVKNDIVGSLRRYGITHYELTPTLARTISLANLPDLECVTLSGEAFDPATVQKWPKFRRLVNAYGPAECAVTATITHLDPENVSSGNIGKGLGLNTWVVSVQNDNELAPMYAVGELWLEGPLVGCGYMNDAQKTATAFVKDPSWLARATKNHRPRHGRLYRTGDLVKYNSDGTLSFCGRKDTQVKIRGQRIELNEVEHHVQQVMESHAQLAPDSPAHKVNVVAEAVKPKGDNRLMLVAFVTVRDWPASDSGHVRPHGDVVQWLARGVSQKLTQSLPSAMVPSAYIPIEQVPCTPSGKTDRLALRQKISNLKREQIASFGEEIREKRPPRNAKEMALQRLCVDALDLDPNAVSMTDSFFKLGGDSILAMKLVALARHDGWQVTVADVFSHPVLASLAETMEETQDPGTTQIVPFSLLEDDIRMQLIDEAIEKCQVTNADVEDMYPCTPLQEGLMAGTARDSSAYILQTAYELHDGVDLLRLQEAWNTMCSVNPITRTRIVATRSGLHQVVVKTPIRWSSSPDLTWYLSSDTADPMGLGEPLTRLALIEPTSVRDSPCFVLTIHHALYDGFSLPLLFEQVEAAYNGETLNIRPFSPFPAYISTMDKSKSDAFWSSQFAEMTAPVFPAVHAAQYHRGPAGRLERDISLFGRSSSEFTTSNSIRLALALLVAHYTSSNDVVFGEIFSGRGASVKDIERMTGPTFATCPVRARFEPQECCRDVLHRLQTFTSASIEFEQTGLHHIRQINPDTASACDFQTHIGIQPAHDDGREPAFFGKRVNIGHLDPFASYALVMLFNLSNDNHTVHVQCNFDLNVLSQWEATSMLKQFEGLLNQIVEDPSRRIDDLQIVSPDDVSQLRQWNSHLPETSDQCVHDMFLHHVVTQPQSMAVSAWDGDLTYAQLDEQSATLASHLIRRGVQQQSVIPLCFDRSVWSIVAIMAVLRAGATCQLIDPTHPPERIAGTVRRSGAVAALCDPSHEHMVAQMVPTVFVVSTKFLRTLHGQDASLKLPTVRPEQAAFIIFTSGSTGTPKGIVLEHRNLSTSIRDHAPGLNLSQSSRSLHFASYAFDASMYEVCSTLGSGGCVCVLSEFDRMNRLADFIRERDVNWATLPSSATSLLQPADVPSLKTLVLGGEAVTQDVAEKWGSRLNLINGYGPAEATICALGAIPPSGWVTGTFGHIVGGRGWVVDQSNVNRLAAIGSVGELLLEGPVLARGYLDDPDKTAALFVQNIPWIRQFGGDANSRFYRSGDLVRYNSDGTLRFAGRKDTQVKLRGQRIELGEVEFRVRCALPTVQSVAAEVITAPGANGKPLLAVFVHLEEQAGPTIHGGDAAPLFVAPTQQIRSTFTKIKSSLSQELPSYMVPSVFIPLSRAPVTSSKKMDRRLLHEQASLLSISEFEQLSVSKPRQQRMATPAEERLRTLTAPIMGMAPMDLGLDDNFFHIGGDSLMAMRLVTALRKAHTSITVRDVFEHPTVAELARWSETSTGSSFPPSSLADVVPGSFFGFSEQDDFVRNVFRSVDGDLKEGGVQDVFPTTRGQAALLRRPCYYFAFEFKFEVDAARLQSACRTLVRQHAILRTVFLPYRGTFVQVVLHDYHQPIRVIKSKLDLPAAMDELWHRDDPQVPVLHRMITEFTLVQDKVGSQALVMRISHAQFDGISSTILWRDLATLYHHGDRGLTGAVDFSMHIRRWLRSRQNTRGLSYWRNLLDGSDMTRINDTRLRNALGVSKPSVVLCERRTILPPTPAGITTATVVKAAWCLILRMLTKRPDVVFGQTVHGRDAVVIPDSDEDLVGPCLNTVPVRVQMKRDWSVGDLLRAIQDQHIRSSEFDTIELPDILSEDSTTDGPNGTEFGSIVTHQNIDLDRPIQSSAALTTEKPVTNGLNGDHGLRDQMWPHPKMLYSLRPTQRVSISTFPVVDELSRPQLEIVLLTSDHILSEDNASLVAQCLDKMIGWLASNPDEPVDEMVPATTPQGTSSWSPVESLRSWVAGREGGKEDGLKK